MYLPETCLISGNYHTQESEVYGEPLGVLMKDRQIMNYLEKFYRHDMEQAMGLHERVVNQIWGWGQGKFSHQPNFHLKDH